MLHALVSVEHFAVYRRSDFKQCELAVRCIIISNADPTDRGRLQKATYTDAVVPQLLIYQ